MIKVNLIRDQSAKKAKRRIRAFPTFSRVGFLMTIALVALAGGLGAWWRSVTQEIQRLEETRDRLRLENNRLQALRKQIVEFEKLKKLKESRIEVIERLKEAQTGPVLLLNHVIQSIPRDSGIWLTALDQKGDRITIVGYTRQPDFIPDFMTNLSGTKFFRSVDLEIIMEEKEGSRFSLTCITSRKVSRD